MRLLLALLITGCTARAASCPPNTIQSPNMGMCVPVVGQDPGPDWANNINASLFNIDQHDHTPGHGVPITPTALNINADLPFNNNNATTLRSARYYNHNTTLITGADVGQTYEVNGDLYYNNGSGIPVQITSGNSPVGSPGTITGLPSGTASASYNAGTFTFNSATNTPATMAVGPLQVGAQIANPKTVTIAPSGSLAANYNLTLPSGLPGSTSFLDSDSSGNMAFVAPTGSGSVVLSTSPIIVSPTINGTPTFSGTPSFTAGINVSGTASSFTDNVTFGSGTNITANGTGLSLNGATVSGNMLFSGTATMNTIAGAPNITGGPAISGGVSVSGGVVTDTINVSSTGGNVPHACTTTTNASGSNVVTVTCVAGRIAMGGGCSQTGSANMLESFPSGGPPATTWNCHVGVTGAATTTAYAICCAY